MKNEGIRRKYFPALWKKLRKTDYSLEELARDCGFSISRMKRLMSGIKPWTLEEAFKVLDELYIPLSELPVYFDEVSLKRCWEKRRVKEIRNEAKHN